MRIRTAWRRLPMPVAAGAGAALVVLLHLFLPPGVGLADNGEGDRLACQVGIKARPAADTTGYFDYLVTDFAPDSWPVDACAGWGSGRYPSSEVVLLRAARAVSQLAGIGPSFDLRTLGVLSAGLMGLGVGCLVALLPGRRRARLLVGVGVTLVVADAGFAAYLVSMYTEPIAFLAIIGVSAAWLWNPARTGPAALALLVLGGCSVALATANDTTGLLALPLAVALIVRSVKGPAPWKRPAIRAMAAVCASVVLVAGVAELSLRPDAIVEADAYNLVFSTVLDRDQPPAEDLVALGLPPSLGVFAGSSFYDIGNATGHPDYPVFRRDFSVARAARLLLARPGRLIGLHRRVAAEAADVRPNDLGNHRAEEGGPAKERSCRVCAVSVLFPSLRWAAWLLLPVAWGMAIRLGRALQRHSRKHDALEWLPVGQLLVLLGSCAAVEYVAVAAMKGSVGATHNLAVANLLTALLLPFGALAAYGVVQLRGRLVMPGSHLSRLVDLWDRWLTGTPVAGATTPTPGPRPPVTVPEPDAAPPRVLVSALPAREHLPPTAAASPSAPLSPPVVSAPGSDAEELAELLEAIRSAARLDRAETRALFDRCRAMIMRLPPGSERTALDVRVHVAIGQILTRSGGYGNEKLGPVRERVRASLIELSPADKPAIAAAWLWDHAVVGGDFVEARNMGGQLAFVASHRDDDDLLAASQVALGVAAFHLGDSGSARDLFGTVLDAGVGPCDLDLSVPLLDQPAVTAPLYAAFGLGLAGDDVGASRMSRQAVGVAARVGTESSSAVSLFGLVMLGAFSRDADEVAAWTKRLATYDLDIDMPAWSALAQCLRAWALADADGDFDASAVRLARALRRLDGAGVRMFRGVLVELLADSYRRSGKQAYALAVVQEGLTETTARGERFLEERLEALYGELLVELQPASLVGPNRPPTGGSER